MENISIENLETFLETITSLLSLRVYWKDKNGTFIGCNENQAIAVGFKNSKEIIGKTDYDMPWKKEADAIHKNDMEVMQNRKKIEKEEISLLANGEQIIFLSQKVPLVDKHNQVIGILGVSFNITDRKKANEAIKTFKKKIEEANKNEIELQHRLTDLEKLSVTDNLTGIWNRTYFNKIFPMEISRGVRYHQPLTLILFDIDHFKRVNDTYGHEVGDHVLCELVKLISKNIRASDMLFRWGGEEFVILMPSTSYHNAKSLTEILRAKVEQHKIDVVGNITISLGVVEYLSNESEEDFFHRVDAAMYNSKNSGRNRVTIDPHGNSDLWAKEENKVLLHLDWQESYYCGEPTIDQQHKKIFELANKLIEAAFTRNEKPKEFNSTLEKLLAHTVKHFADEEAILTKHHYADIDTQARAHKLLTEHALRLRDAATAGTVTMGALVDFLADEVVAQHMLKVDRAFYPLFNKSIKNLD